MRINEPCWMENYAAFEAQVERAECCIRMCGSPLIRRARASFVARVFFSSTFFSHSPVLEQKRPGEKKGEKMNIVTNGRRKGRAQVPSAVAPLRVEQQRRAE